MRDGSEADHLLFDDEYQRHLHDVTMTRATLWVFRLIWLSIGIAVGSWLT